MSFKKKQLLGFGLILLLLAILLNGIVYMVNNLKSNLNEIVEDRYYKVETSMEIRQAFTRSDREILYAANNASKKERDESLDIIDENHLNIQEGIAKLSSTLNTDKGKELLSRVQSEYASYQLTEKEIINEIENGNSQLNLVTLLNDQKNKRIGMISALEEFKDFQDEIMDEAFTSAKKTYNEMVLFIIVAFSICLITVFVTAFWVIRSTTRNLKSITDVIQKVDYKNLEEIPRINVSSTDEIGDIARSFNDMAGFLEEYTQKEKEFTSRISEQNWIQTRLADIATMYQRIIDIEVLGQRLITRLAPMIDASLGAFYIKRGEREKTHFVKLASFADEGVEVARKQFRLGEGVIGQCALEKRSQIINQIPEGYNVITTGLGNTAPKSILIVPVVYEDEVVAVIEMASLTPFTAIQQKLIANISETLGISINNVQGRMEIERLLKESQAQTEELQAQAEELQTQSEELQAQSEELQTQSEELRMINEQLEERNRETEEKSRELQRAKVNLESQAEELKQSSRYKSEFLANMSHELRTPLNSILILSEMLTDQPEEPLTEEQKEYARVIHSSGQDLLTLINDILDLSKVEVGKLEVVFDETNLSELPSLLKRNFEHIASRKGIEFTVEKDKDVPNIFFTDEQRFLQILKNLLSNAFKFTEKGSVQVRVQNADEEQAAQWIHTKGAQHWLQITVSDTGIGIPVDKQKLIFEAFQQADGATIRKYGGTGLGLSISREFTSLLGGWITVESEEGVGSVFTVYIPSLPEGIIQTSQEAAIATEEVAAATMTEPISSMAKSESETEETPPVDESNFFKNKTVLVVDDDHRNIFALKNALENEGMDIITAENGMECLEILQSGNSIDAVLMDIMMPEMDGYETMRRIRSDNYYENLPIIALTAKAMKGDREKCLKAGASDYISKPLKLDQLLSVLRVWLSN